MENSTYTIVLVSRAVLSVGFLAAGIYALRIGFRLYMTGVGLRPESTEIAASQGKYHIKISLQKVGSMVMLTSVLWGVLAYLSLPRVNEQTEGNRHNVEIPRK